MNSVLKEHLQTQLTEIREAGLYKSERTLSSAQNIRIEVEGGLEALNFCANNYLGLAQHPEVRDAAIEGIRKWGYGLASVRFICGTQTLHTKLEAKLSGFLKTDDTILYSSCFDANGGLFETLLGPEDAILSDALNHASIIDGIRLCKAQRYRYGNSDMADLEEQLKQASSSRFRLIVTDGVFSMDGHVANLPAICELADRYDCLVMVDDSHAVGFMGKNGRGTHEHHNVEKRIDILTGTLGKALGGASGGYTSGRKEIVELLRQRSRPYLFSNTLAPAIATGSIKALELLESSTNLRDRLETNAAYFRKAMAEAGFQLIDGLHPIIPIMIGDAKKANELANLMLKKGIYVIGFSYPVVPKGLARIRTQISAAHSQTDLDFAIEKFKEAGEELGLI
ncbi:MAG: glycine C-acetyltransferase [Opitutales bacterium]|jgi:glycine C-acetyltransferase|nr:glycine C-acetyltransferase [Opitutales bacterium]MBT5814170.1 glycine C-acetyltransferase [Opitutales bacterium]MBT6380373.1 glycine C-acetyltransferase [Opitutales bacterium]MBT6767548.1 glycine C-acetyltransferase [Opitutales bacterium]MBT7865685.1 glycine C-acetyltransferase [Opitutales bacterium]